MNDRGRNTCYIGNNDELRICVTLFSHNSCYLILHQTEMTWNALINFLCCHIKKRDSSPMVNITKSLVTFKGKLYCVDSFLFWFNPRCICCAIFTIIKKLIMSTGWSCNQNNTSKIKKRTFTNMRKTNLTTDFHF